MDREAVAEGRCTFQGQSGFTFRLEVIDVDSRLVGSRDVVRLIVEDTFSNVVYDVEERFSIGDLEIKK
jgi:hypothetical protein